MLQYNRTTKNIKTNTRKKKKLMYSIKIKRKMSDSRTSSMINFLEKMIVLGKLTSFTNKKILDIGSGSGFGINVIKALGGIPLGIEIDEKKVSAAYQSGIKPEELINTDAAEFIKKSTAIQNAASTYDGVTIFLAPLYDGSFCEVIQRMGGILKSNATIILTTPTPIEMELATPLLQETNIVGTTEWHPEIPCDKYVFIGRKM